MASKRQRERLKAKLRRKGEPSIPDFSYPVSDEAHKFFAALAKESPRGMVLITASLLDEALELLLRRTIFPLPKGDDARASHVEWAFGLSENDGPLQSFNSRIRIAYAVGAIGPNALMVLQAIRWVRNLFAHQVSITFDEPAVAEELVDKFVPPLRSREEQSIIAYIEGKRAEAAGVKRQPDESTLLFGIKHGHLFVSVVPLTDEERSVLATHLADFERGFLNMDTRNQYLTAFGAIYGALWQGIRAAEKAAAARLQHLGEKPRTLADYRFGYTPAELGLG